MKVIAILCSDMHLAVKPPVCRMGEDDWYTVMGRVLSEIDYLANEKYEGVPILCAGDVFDRWNSSPELINLALTMMPDMYSIPGQHDLPSHRHDMAHKSAYQTLLLAGTITDVSTGVGQLWGDKVPNQVIKGAGIHIYLFPWGSEIKPCPDSGEDLVKVALIHRFIWHKEETGYQGVSSAEHLTQYKAALKGYDVAVFGDNHKGFKVHSDKFNQTIINCGTMMRRTVSECNYKPRVGLLYSDGSVKYHYLDISRDKMSVPVIDNSSMTDFSAFAQSLEDLGEDPLDFRDAINRALPSCSDGAARVLTDTLESYGG